MAVKFTKRLIFFQINDIEFTPTFVVTIVLDGLLRYMKAIKANMMSTDYH